MKKMEGYTNCIKKPARQLFSFHFNHKFNELSILNNVDLGNRAYKLNIPLPEIKELLHKDKDKLIFQIMLKEERIFDLKKELEKRKKQNETVKKPKGTPTKKYKFREIDGYDLSTIGHYP
tara:strand:+ start:1140 stop:1499 length:360 start_codon:yes stop_codon:yes gene_type:complete